MKEYIKDGEGNGEDALVKNKFYASQCYKTAETVAFVFCIIFWNITAGISCNSIPTSVYISKSVEISFALSMHFY